MAFFLRGEEPPRYSDCRSYRPFLRRDFRHQCAYCERTEGYIGDPEFFGIDHFRPKSTFPKLECEYSNLYYCCNRCNRTKSNRWPSPADLDRGRQFADPCESDPYAVHFVEEPNNVLKPLTPAGEYTTTVLRLNDPSCLRFRIRRSRLAAAIASAKAEIRGGGPSEILPIIEEMLAVMETEWNQCYRR